MSDLVASDRLLLAFDTSSAVGSVALGREGVLLAHIELEQQRKHASGLVPAIGTVLLEAGIDKSEYEMLVSKMPEKVEWSKLAEYEKTDMTIGSQELACSAGFCEIQ